jgi:acyl transferase domain-containing protein
VPSPTSSPTPTGPVAVTGFALRAGILRELEPFLDALAKDLPIAPGETLELPLEGLRFPPRDLGQTLSQQLLILEAATEAAAQAGTLPRDRTSVVIGMECDPHIVRHGLRARLPDLPAARDKSAAWLKDLQNQLADPLSAAHVIGCLPNIVTNRINAQLDLAGPSFSLSSDENSGLDALRFALGELRARRIDAALVGAIDLCPYPMHEAAAREVLPSAFHNGGDAAICFVLKRLDDARHAGDDILAIIEGNPGNDETTPLLPRIASTLGHAHAASGLLAYASRLFESAPPKVYVEEISGRKVSLVAANPRELAAKRVRALHAIEHGASPGEGVYLDAPLKGEVAMTFTGAAAAYQGMGRPLMNAFPGLTDGFRARFSNFDEATRWMLSADPNARPTPLDKLFASSVLSQLHADLTTHVLGITYDAAIGFSSGETNALFASGVWSDFSMRTPKTRTSASVSSGIVINCLKTIT